MMEGVLPGQLRIWGDEAGWQDRGKVFMVLFSSQDMDYCDILQDGRSVRVKVLFIEAFSDPVR